MCYYAVPVKAWSRRDPRNPRRGLSDPEARVGRGRRRAFFLGYKTHCSGDWNSEEPTAYVVASVNENEKKTLQEGRLKGQGTVSKRQVARGGQPVQQ